MAVFNKNIRNTNSQATIISSGVSIKGELSLSSMLYVEGSVEGVIVSDNTVVIGKNGNVKGIIKANKVVINGNFEGNIDSEFVEMLNGSLLIGDISTNNLSVENGAKFNGKSIIKDQNSTKSLENLEIIETEESSASKDL
ncbi:putative bactofilin domain protein [Campylobacter iguaniorum]|uniref:bactofilin family protein n=1 Tax=Campylobacter iguaniorum TaxID=1244531 RepID=UPI0007C8F485|nr:polymer-forming cytoskeletal protein [Campylobacter iguaniorum]ANE35794.1 putative bactofilin domain protein [Campylobacter iguaniorum]